MNSCNRGKPGITKNMLNKKSLVSLPEDQSGHKRKLRHHTESQSKIEKKFMFKTKKENAAT